MAEPAISPDGATIVFASGGDLWSVPAAGGDAHLLVSDPATESRPHWSPDGKQIAFVSNRTGTGDIYVLTLESGEVRRVTWDDAPELLDGWSAVRESAAAAASIAGRWPAGAREAGSGHHRFPASFTCLPRTLNATESRSLS
jgi:Tol biopolymer transport system component